MSVLTTAGPYKMGKNYSFLKFMLDIGAILGIYVGDWAGRRILRELGILTKGVY
jgi:hypothetical protein